MKTPFSSKNLSEPVRRHVDMAVAVAQERLLGTHVLYALDLVALIGDQVPFDEALDIYTRLLRLSSDEARIVTTRAMATLGERAGQGAPWPGGEPDPKADGEAGEERDGTAEPGEKNEAPRSRSLIGQLRDRMRNRDDAGLRFVIELEAARTEEALLNTHVENALNFVELVEKELPPTDIVELYLDALGVRESISEVIYHLTLSRLSEDRLPDARQPQAVRPERLLAKPADRDAASDDAPLRIVDSEAD